MDKNFVTEQLCIDLRKGNFPIALSKEFVETNKGEGTVIRFTYQGEDYRDIIYTPQTFDEGMKLFNEIWKSANITGTDFPSLH